MQIPVCQNLGQIKMYLLNYFNAKCSCVPSDFIRPKKTSSVALFGGSIEEIQYA